jgi:hypothetical protein
MDFGFCITGRIANIDHRSEFHEELRGSTGDEEILSFKWDRQNLSTRSRDNKKRSKFALVYSLLTLKRVAADCISVQNGVSVNYKPVSSIGKYKLRPYDDNIKKRYRARNTQFHS